MKEKISEKFEATFTFIKNHYWPLLIISLPILILIEIINALLLNQQLFNWLFNILSTGFFYALLIFVINSIFFKNTFSLQNVAAYLSRSFINVALALFAIGIVTQVGVLLLILPGIYLAARLAITPYLIGLHNINLADAFKLSWKYSERDLWLIGVSLLLVSIPAAILYIILLFSDNYLTTAILNILIHAYSIVGYILIFYFYLDIKSYMIGIQDIQNG